MFRRILNTIRALATSGVKNPASWLVDWIRGDQSDSGIAINSKSVLKYSAVWYAVNKIAGHAGVLPLLLKHHDEQARKTTRAKWHPAYKLLKRRPNSLMTPMDFKELLTYHMIVWGNGRALIDRNRRGQPISLIPMLPDRTETVLIGNEKWHLTKPDGLNPLPFPDRDVVHLKGLGFDGLEGYPLWEFARNSFGLGLATERHGNRFFRNNASPSVILEVPTGVLTDDEEAKRFLSKFKSMHEGADNAFKAAMLRDGIKATALAQSGQESQWIEQRQFQRQEVALWFLLESITGDDSSVSYNSLEQKHLAYLTNCLNRWLTKWQQECEAKLLSPAEQEADELFCRFNTGALLRADMKTTYQTLVTGVRGTLITQNEAREVLDLDAIEGGDVLINPAIQQMEIDDGEDNEETD